MASRFSSSLAVKVLVSILIGAAVLELSTRTWLWARGRPHDGRAILTEMRRTVEGMQRAFEDVEAQEEVGEGDASGSRKVLRRDRRNNPRIAHPYLAWENADAIVRLSEDLAHFAGPEHEETFDVLVLGSSVGAGFMNEGQRWFREEVASDLRLRDRPVRFLCYARGSYKQPQQALALVYLLSLGIEPDAVIDIDGFNETMGALRNFRRGVHPSYPIFSHWAQVIDARPDDPVATRLRVRLEVHRLAARDVVAGVERYGLARSAVLAWVSRLRLRRAQVRWAAAQEELTAHMAAEQDDAVLGPAFEGDRRDALREAVAGWMRSLRLMHALCEARSIPFLYVLQPNPGIPGSKVLTALEVERTRQSDVWAKAAEDGYPMMMRGLVELTADPGIRAFDATGLFRDVAETVWIDSGHLNDAGNELLARRVAAEILAILP